MRPALTSLPLVAALAWTAALVARSDPFGEAGALLVGLGMLATSAVAVIGMVVSGGRWAHRLALASVGMTLVVALMRPIDALWVLGLVASGVAASALFVPMVTSRIRKLPAAAGPPQAAVVIPLVLLAVPFLIGVSLGDGAVWAGLTVGLSAPLAAFLFSRVIPGGLLAVRVVWPGLTLALSPLLGAPAAPLTWAAVMLIGLLAWRPEVKASFHPPVEAGSTYPIPPELAPKEILDAARLDDEGRRH